MSALSFSAETTNQMGLISILTSRNGKPGLGDVSLACRGLTYEHKRNSTLVWRTDEGDAVGLYYFDRPSRLPSSASSDAGFKSRWTQCALASGVEVLELEWCRAAGTDSLRSIVRVVTPRFGVTFIGGLTLPFDGFYYVAKIESGERPFIGFHDVLLNRSRGDCSPDHPLFRVRRWMPRIEAGLNVTERLRAYPLQPVALSIMPDVTHL